jgi:GNAT superfamily N-acetyltransferase
VLQVRRAHIHDESAAIAVILAAMGTYGRWHPGWAVPEDAEERERARWLVRDPAVSWLVACMNERVVGVSRWVKSEPAVLSLLMVHPDNWGAGVGSTLHASVSRGMIDDGLRAARLTVPEDNARARRFYEHNGWRKASTPAATHAWLELPMLEYRRAVNHVLAEGDDLLLR